MRQSIWKQGYSAQPLPDSFGEAGEAVLMCMDGSWEHVPEKSKSPRDWLRRMEKVTVRRAEKRHDNYSEAAAKAKKA